jgi:hypothetical protein
MQTIARGYIDASGRTCYQCEVAHPVPRLPPVQGSHRQMEKTKVERKCPVLFVNHRSTRKMAIVWIPVKIPKTASTVNGGGETRKPKENQPEVNNLELMILRSIF